MATATSSLELVKPELQDTFNLKYHLNDNWDKIDTAYNENAGKIDDINSRYIETAKKNIFNATSIEEGKFINYTNGAIQANPDYFYTVNGSRVEPNTTYVGTWWNTNGTLNSKMTQFVLFYDETDAFISGLQIGTALNGVFTTPEDCYFIRYSGRLTVWNTLLLQIEKGDTPSTSYEEYIKVITHKKEYLPIDYIKAECNKRAYIYVDKKGNGDYTTVTEAVSNAEDGATVVVAPGVYENEIVEAWGKEIHIVGVSREACIISNSTADYSTPPVEIGRGSLENLTIIAEYGTGTSTGWLPYAVHTEDNNLYNGVLTIRNCTLISELNASFGLGMRGGCVINIENSQLIGRKGTGNRALYFHDAASATYAGEQNINIINSLLTSDTNTATTVKIEDQCVEGSSINITMINTLIHNEKGTTYRVGTLNTGGGTYDGWRNLKNTTLSEKSFGNNIDIFNS